MGTIHIKAALVLGLASYCLVLLISRDAAYRTLAIMGIMALSLTFVSMALLWKTRKNLEAPIEVPQISNPDILYPK